jgi:hypothetical protein
LCGFANSPAPAAPAWRFHALFSQPLSNQLFAMPISPLALFSSHMYDKGRKNDKQPEKLAEF